MPASTQSLNNHQVRLAARPSGLPRAAGYTTGFAVMAGGLVLAALAGLLMPSARRLRQLAGEPEHAELAMVAGGTIVGDDSE